MSSSKWRAQFERFRKRFSHETRANRKLMLAAFLKDKKRHMVGRPGDPQLAHKRARNRKLFTRTRAKIMRSEYGRRRSRLTISSTNLLLYEPTEHFLRDSLSPNFMKRCLPVISRMKKQRSSVIDLTNFSFARNPKGTLSQIRNLVRQSAVCLDIKVNFTDKQCDDVAPYIILANLMRSLPPVFSGGMINREVAAVIESVGLDRLLGVNRVRRERSPFPILPFKMAFRAPPGYFGDKEHQLRPQYMEFIADRFCNTLEHWLSAEGFELTPDGAQALITSITEALDNAERHGSPEFDQGMGDWSMAGFSKLIQNEAGEKRLECAVSIVSIGSTISESLSTAGPKVSKLVDGYANLQQKQNGLSSELGRSVAALQDGITRDKAASQANRGGIGLLTLADLFADLGETNQVELKSVFTILSGKACMRITSPYKRGMAKPETTLRNLWFNDTNSGNSRPDSDHAFMIDEKFAGTVLTARFCIDPVYLQQKLAV